MSNLGILDLVIGIFFIYFTLSVICTAIVEGIAQMRELRSRHLKKWVTDNFGEVLGDKVLEHGLIKGLTQKSYKADYIPSDVFFVALFENIDKLHREGEAIPEDWKQYFLKAVDESRFLGDNLNVAKKQFEDWYNEAMESIIGTYKKRTRVITWMAAVIVTLVTNADTISLSKYLKENPTVTAKLVEAAEQATQDSVIYRKVIDKLTIIDQKLDKNVPDSVTADLKGTISDLKKNQIFIKDTYQAISTTGLPLGWKNAIIKFEDRIDKRQNCELTYYLCLFFQKFVGLLMTALALTLGAPFWFDMINKLANVRTAGKKPEDSESNRKISPIA
ncbi:MAG: hypothetical protein ACKV1O_17485 [Saprospiraceae bacterium]